MRKVFEILTEIAPELEVDGEMHAVLHLMKIFVILHSQIHALKVQRTC